jgi:uncharacterized damage-inducible protein DinB
MPDRFIEKSRAMLLDECLPKIRLATQALTDDDTWWRPVHGSNSIGNLIVHIEGNARQWLIGGVGRQPGTRDRDAEFASTSGGSIHTLVDALTTTFLGIDAVLGSLTSATLDEPRVIQGENTSVFDAVFHVVTHVNLHTGQIIQLAKWRAPGTVRLYDASGTGFTRLWQPTPRPR